MLHGICELSKIFDIPSKYLNEGLWSRADYFYPLGYVNGQGSPSFKW